MLITGADLLRGGTRERHWLRIEGGRVAGLGRGEAPTVAGEERRDLGGRLVLAGFIDCHVHGGGGGSFTSGDPAEILRAVAFHRSRGTTRTLASLVTAPEADLLAAIGPLAELAEDGTIEGLHLEGPFLSRLRCGAQDPRYLLEPDPALLSRLFRAARGTVRMVTVAPELPGALDLVRQVVDAGAIAAIGHSDATFAAARAAIDAGARVATHLFNGMRPLHHRQPGIVGAALTSEEVVCELIADGQHLHPATTALSFAAAPGRVALVTDALAAAGSADGLYQLGPTRVRVREGVALVEGSESLAGSTAGTADLLRHAVLGAGVALAAASAALSATPARLLGLDDAGSLEAGRSADLVVLDDELAVLEVMRSGLWS